MSNSLSGTLNPPAVPASPGSPGSSPMGPSLFMPTSNGKEGPNLPSQTTVECYYEKVVIKCSHCGGKGLGGDLEDGSAIDRQARKFAELEFSCENYKVKSSLDDKLRGAKRSFPPDRFEVVAATKDQVDVSIIGHPLGKADTIKIELRGADKKCSQEKHHHLIVIDDEKNKVLTRKESATSISFDAYPKSPAVPFGGFLAKSTGGAAKIEGASTTAAGYAGSVLEILYYLWTFFRDPRSYTVIADACPYRKDNDYKKVLGGFWSLPVDVYPSDAFKFSVSTDPKFKGKGSSDSKTDDESSSKAETDSVLQTIIKSASLKRNDEELIKDAIHQRTGMANALLKWGVRILNLIEVAHAWENKLPKVGFWMDYDYSFLKGDIQVQWAWKEADDHTVFFWLKGVVSLTLFDGKIAVNWGARVDMPLTPVPNADETEGDSDVAEAKLRLEVNGKAKVESKEFELKPDEPEITDAKSNGRQIGTFKTPVGIEFSGSATIPGEILNANAKLKSGIDMDANIWVGGPHPIHIEGGYKFQEITVEVTFEAFWKKVHAKKTTTLKEADEDYRSTFQFPHDEETRVDINSKELASEFA